MRSALLRCATRVAEPLLRWVDPCVDAAAEILVPAQRFSFPLERVRFIGHAPGWTDDRELQLPAMCAMDLSGAEVVGRGFILDRHGRVVPGSAYGDRAYMREYREYHLLLLHRAFRAEQCDRVMPLLHFQARNYFHWVLESLGRLAMIDDRVAPGGIEYVIDPSAPRFVRESLVGLFGIPEQRIHPMHTRRITARTVRYVSFPHVIGPGRHNINVYRPQVIHRLARIARTVVGDEAGHGDALIIIRGSGNGRGILGHERIIERFPAIPWRVVRPEELSFMEQVRLFAGARLVLATHGAGLTNLVFAPNARVVEFFPTRRKALDSSYFIQISGALGLPHTIIGYDGGPEADLVVTDGMLDRLHEVLHGYGLMDIA